MDDSEGSDDDFLRSFGGLDVSDDLETNCSPVKESNEKRAEYNSKKPKWWKNLCGKATKSQKRAMEYVLKTKRCPSVEYGSFINWEELFPKGNDIWFELGFGRGENLLALAHRKRTENISLVGAEIHKPGIGAACQKIKYGMENNQYWTDYVTYAVELDPNSKPLEQTATTVINSGCSEPSQPYENLRLYHGDGVKFLQNIPSKSIAAVLVTFPDPFPREKENEWRVIQTHTILQIHRILRESGLFFLATDHYGYNDWSHSVMEKTNNEKLFFKRLDPCPNRMEWLPAISTYEQKGWNEGRQTRLNCWQVLPV